MVVVDHPSFRLPENLDTPIWRYIDFAKFVSMLDKEDGSLHFTRADKFEDCFEGLPPKVIQTRFENKFAKAIALQLDEDSRNDVRTMIEMVRVLAQSVPISTGINCWCCGKHESTAMWKLYSTSQGIAIQSTVHCLLDVFEEIQEPVRVGLVDYRDDGMWSDLNKTVSMSQLYQWILRKRPSFSHECELRAIIGDLQFPPCIFPENGKTVPVPVKKLIKSVIVMPGASSWFTELTRRTCERYELDVKVVESNLDERPLWQSLTGKRFQPSP